MDMPITRQAFFCFGGLCLFALGCSTGSEPAVYPVSGRVEIEGKPLVEALVVLHPVAGDGRSFVARTDTDGRFQLTTHKIGDGAPAGEYAVTFEFRELVQEGDEPMRVGRNLLPARYSAPQTSEVRCEVKATSNELSTWNLKWR